MTRLAETVQIAVPFVWLGMVVAISLIEAPLKFRAPGITLPLGLGIGRLVFRALNRAELILLAALGLSLLGSLPDAAGLVLLCLVAAILLVQVLALRPRMDHRARSIIDGARPARSRLHHAYVALESAKVLALPALGVLLALRLLD